MSVVLRKRLLIGLFFVLSAIGLAQQSGSGTKLTGQIVDQQGGALQGAAAILVNGAGTVRLQQTSSGQDGMFSFAGLAPGDYVLDVTCASVLTMIGVAYIENGSPLLNNPGLLEREPEQILAMPKWALPARYTIHAVSGDPAANSQADAGPGGGHLAGLLYGPMLQSVLEDRFQLRIHREVDEVPMYALAVANTGFGLNPMRDGECTEPQRLAGGGIIVEPIGPNDKPYCGWVGWPIHGPNRTLLGGGITIERLARSLATFVLDRNVVDRTGIAGSFIIHLEYAPDQSTRCFGPSKMCAVDPNSDIPLAPTIFIALKQQLGLELEEIKGPKEHILIDRVEQPLEN